LLAALGRMAQDFCVALENADADTERDALDEAEPQNASGALLGALQSSIRCAEPALVRQPLGENVHNAASPDTPETATLRQDASLRVHACHTRLRELEVLRDALLGFLSDDATLTHSDIVVLAPDIGRYAPILPAIFGEPARYDSDSARIPWHLADVTLARAHPLMSVCLRLLDLAESRFGVSDVMDLLDVPAVARRFGIDAAARVQLEHALRRARVAWGLDADMKAQMGAAPVAANSWQFGFDRLYAGFALGDDTPYDVLDDVLAVNGVSGGVADAVGRLDLLLHELREMRAGFASSRPLAAWCAWLQRHIDAVMRVDARDETEMTAYAALQRVLNALAEQESAAGRELPLSWSVAREALRGAFDTIAEHQPFLLGGVTFCGMVPQRSIPFRVVCLLGMNEGEFPRAAGDTGLNRMHAKARLGDRDTRHEDRYLFLEALMAARERLHISYVGEDANSGTVRNPATPLAELLQFLDEQFERGEGDERAWFIKHPLQPFDARYYHAHDAHADPRLFTFSTAFARLPEIGAIENVPFLSAAARSAIDVPHGDVSLAMLRRFWRNPLRAALRDRAGVSLEMLADDSWPDREPLEASFERRELVESRLLFDALGSDGGIPATAPPWLALSGALAAGPAGALAYAQARECALAALQLAREHLGAHPRIAAQAVNLDLGDGVHLRGVLDRVFRLPDSRLCLFDAKPWRRADFRDLVPFYIDWAALRLTTGDVALAHFVEKDAKSTTAVAPELLDVIVRQTPAQLRDGLRGLVDACNQAQPLLFPPQTAWEWANAEPGRQERKARQAWEGDGWGTRGERRHSPGYAGLLGRDLALFETGSEAHARFLAALELVSDALDPGRAVLCRAQGAAP
jgi:exodeoxyribonuclease V gamma subunit